MAQHIIDEQEFKQLERHPSYYINGGDVYFLADNQLFRVHRYFFERESRVFREQFKQPMSPGQPCKGDDESVAIVLDVPASDFEKLLGVFYNPRYSLYDWTSDDWTTILELAHKWEFKEVTDLAIRGLGNQMMPTLTRIVLYQRMGVDIDLLVPLYVELCGRPEALDEEESVALGMKTTVLIFRARERLRALPSDGGRSPLPPGLETEDVHRTILSLLEGTPVTSPTEGQTGERSKTPGRDTWRMAVKKIVIKAQREAGIPRIRMDEPVDRWDLLEDGEVRCSLNLNNEVQDNNQMAKIETELASRSEPSLQESIGETSFYCDDPDTVSHFLVFPGAWPCE